MTQLALPLCSPHDWRMELRRSCSPEHAQKLGRGLGVTVPDGYGIDTWVEVCRHCRVERVTYETWRPGEVPDV